jgi:NCAIR mutase (PurE)-related protein
MMMMLRLCTAPDRFLSQTAAGHPIKVGVLMGSPNDLPKMKGAVDMLRHFGLEPDVKVLSAHRQPHEVGEMAMNARANGYAAFICGAGMAAHLAGVVSAHTTLPVSASAGEDIFRFVQVVFFSLRETETRSNLHGCNWL